MRQVLHLVVSGHLAELVFPFNAPLLFSLLSRPVSFVTMDRYSEVIIKFHLYKKVTNAMDHHTK